MNGPDPSPHAFGDEARSSTAVDERKRHALYERLDELLDHEHADTLMDLPPPVGWADVVSKQDLRLEIAALDHKIDAVDARMQAGFSELRAELHRELRQQLWAILGVLLVAVVLSEALSRIS